jgi:hypothetical protein
MAPKKLENNFLVNTLGKLLVFLLNYAYYATLFIMKKLGKGCFWSFGTHYRYFHFLWGKQSWLTTSLSYDQPSGTNWVRKSRAHCIIKRRRLIYWKLAERSKQAWPKFINTIRTYCTLPPDMLWLIETKITSKPLRQRSLQKNEFRAWGFPTANRCQRWKWLCRITQMLKHSWQNPNNKEHWLHKEL